MSALEKSPRFETVNVGGEAIAAANVDGTVWVSVRRMCEALGMDTESQRKRLADSERSPWATTVMMTGVGADGRNREVFCLDLDSVPMWLATIDTSRVAEHARPKVVLFQREAAKVLRDHFFGPRSPSMLPSRTEALRLALEASERADALEAQVLALAPKAAFADRVSDTTNALPMGAVAKLFGMGRQTLFDRLRALGIIEKRPSTRPYAEHLVAKRFEVREVIFSTNTRGEQSTTVTKVTGKGQIYIAKRLGLLDKARALQAAIPSLSDIEVE